MQPDSIFIEDVISDRVANIKSMAPRCLGAWIPYEFVKRNGQIYRSGFFENKYPKGFQKQCFWNSIQVARKYRGLHYFEGYCLDKKIGFDFLHAWNVDKDNRVIDTTLDNLDRYEYMGVSVNLLDYRKYTKKNSSSVFDTMSGMNMRFFIDKDPDIKDLMEPDLRECLERMSRDKRYNV